jgi:hypothetical protein
MQVNKLGSKIDEIRFLAKGIDLVIPSEMEKAYLSVQIA